MHPHGRSGTMAEAWGPDEIPPNDLDLPDPAHADTAAETDDPADIVGGWHGEAAD